MTSSVFLFWLCFLLPGLRMGPTLEPLPRAKWIARCGGDVGLCVPAAVCVFIVPAHVLGLPTLALSAGLVAFVLWGVVDLTRSRQWSGLARLVIAAAGGGGGLGN